MEKSSAIDEKSCRSEDGWRESPAGQEPALGESQIHRTSGSASGCAKSIRDRPEAYFAEIRQGAPGVTEDNSTFGRAYASSG
jgi:hypothetical protein